MIGDDSSRMSFSSTSSSKDSSSGTSGMNNGNVLQSSLSEPGKIHWISEKSNWRLSFQAISTSMSNSDDTTKTLVNNPIPTNGKNLFDLISIEICFSSRQFYKTFDDSIDEHVSHSEYSKYAHVDWHFSSTENEPITPSISRAEREQEIQKFYRADLIQHLTSWPSTQLEKQVHRQVILFPVPMETISVFQTIRWLSWMPCENVHDIRWIKNIQI